MPPINFDRLGALQNQLQGQSENDIAQTLQDLQGRNADPELQQLLQKELQKRKAGAIPTTPDQNPLLQNQFSPDITSSEEPSLNIEGKGGQNLPIAQGAKLTDQQTNAQPQLAPSPKPQTATQIAPQTAQQVAPEAAVQAQAQEQGQAQQLQQIAKLFQQQQGQGQNQEQKSAQELAQEQLPDNFKLRQGLAGAGQQLLQSDAKNLGQTLLAAGTGALSGTLAADQAEQQVVNQIQERRSSLREQILKEQGKLQRAKLKNTPEVVQLQNRLERARTNGNDELAKRLTDKLNQITGQGPKSSAFLDEQGNLKDETTARIKKGLEQSFKAIAPNREITSELARPLNDAVATAGKLLIDKQVQSVGQARKLAFEQALEKDDIDIPTEGSINLEGEPRRRVLNENVAIAQVLPMFDKALQSAFRGTGIKNFLGKLAEGGLGQAASELSNPTLLFPNQAVAQERLRLFNNLARRAFRLPGSTGLRSKEFESTGEALITPENAVKNPQAAIVQMQELFDFLADRFEQNTELLRGQTPSNIPRFRDNEDVNIQDFEDIGIKPGDPFIVEKENGNFELLFRNKKGTE